MKATGNGVSMITDYQGRMLADQTMATAAGLWVATVPTRGVVTIYSRIGGAFAYLCAAGLIFLVVRAFFRTPAELASMQ